MITIAIRRTPDPQPKRAERAASRGQDAASYTVRLIERDIDARTVDGALEPCRRQVREGGMSDAGREALVEAAREEGWREKPGRPSRSP